MTTTVTPAESNGQAGGSGNTGSGAAALVQLIGTLGALVRAIIVPAQDETLRRLTFSRVLQLLLTGRLAMTLTHMAEILLLGRTLIEQLTRMERVVLTNGSSSALARALAVEMERIADHLRSTKGRPS